MLREILVPEREGITEDWVLPHNEELHNLYSSTNELRMDEVKEDNCWDLQRPFE